MVWLADFVRAVQEDWFDTLTTLLLRFTTNVMLLFAGYFAAAALYYWQLR